MGQNAGVDSARRAAVLERLEAATKIDVARAVARQDELIATGTSERFIARHADMSKRYRADAVHDTMLMFRSYQTDTLDHFVSKLDDPSDRHKTLYNLLSFDGNEWNMETGDQRDLMFRDLLTMCTIAGLPRAGTRMFSLREVYRAFDLVPGDILMMQDEHKLHVIKSVFITANNSRTVLWLGRGAEKPKDHSGHPYDRQADIRALHESYRVDHLRSEVVEYLKVNPERKFELRDHMTNRRETLPDIDFDLFLAMMDSHRSLRDGVL